jgi:hypothetical protein
LKLKGNTIFYKDLFNKCVILIRNILDDNIFKRLDQVKDQYDCRINHLTYFSLISYTVSGNFIWDKSEDRAPYGIYWPRIYRIRSLAHYATNILYWLPLNEGIDVTASKLINMYFLVVCEWSICVAIWQVIEPTFGDKVTLVNCNI